MRTHLRLVPLVALLCLAPASSGAVEYTLEVQNLRDAAFRYYVRGPVGQGVGELLLPGLERAIDAGTVSGGSFLYDRDTAPAGPDVARAFDAVPARVVAASSGEGRGGWTAIRWYGEPGERVVWVIRPATTHWQQASELALGEGEDDLRYFLPYDVTLSPTPARVVAYPLAVLRQSENGSPLWATGLARALDVRSGLAAVVGVNHLAGDWVYLIIDQPTEPTTFKAVVGWARRGPNDRIQEDRALPLRFRR